MTLIVLCIAPQSTSLSLVMLSLTRGGQTHHTSELSLMIMTCPLCRRLRPHPHHLLLLIPMLLLPTPLLPLPLLPPLLYSPHLLPRIPSTPSAPLFGMMTRATQLYLTTNPALQSRPKLFLPTKHTTWELTRRPWHAAMPPIGMLPVRIKSGTSR